MNIAGELEKHAGQELQHALTIAKQIDYLGGPPTMEPKPVVNELQVKNQKASSSD
jgi:bacterioferritin